MNDHHPISRERIREAFAAWEREVRSGIAVLTPEQVAAMSVDEVADHRTDMLMRMLSTAK